MSSETRCPGSLRGDQLQPREESCAQCGYAMEVWPDEPRAKCPRCGSLHVGEGWIPSCVEWCPAAERCLGNILDVAAIKQRAAARSEGKGTSFVKEVARLLKERQARRTG